MKNNVSGRPHRRTDGDHRRNIHRHRRRHFNRPDRQGGIRQTLQLGAAILIMPLPAVITALRFPGMRGAEGSEASFVNLPLQQTNADGTRRRRKHRPEADQQQHCQKLSQRKKGHGGVRYESREYSISAGPKPPTPPDKSSAPTVRPIVAQGIALGSIRKHTGALKGRPNPTHTGARSFVLKIRCTYKLARDCGMACDLDLSRPAGAHQDPYTYLGRCPRLQ
jgi:hypothetical protein